MANERPTIHFQPHPGRQKRVDPDPIPEKDYQLADALLPEREYDDLVLKDFPVAARKAIEEIAAREKMHVTHWIIYQSLVALAGHGLDPCPNWRPHVYKS